MTIDRIGSPEPIQSGKRPGQTGRSAPVERSDTIDLSSEAVERSEFQRLMELVAAAPLQREDRIAELREKINDPSYINERIGATADRIMDVFGL